MSVIGAILLIAALAGLLLFAEGNGCLITLVLVTIILVVIFL